MTRQQRYLSQAYDDITAFDEDSGVSKPAKRIYGGLCHKTPVLVRTNGLCQTLALIEEKAAGKNSSRKLAYRTLRAHIAGTLGVKEDDLLRTVQRAEVGEYIRHTRALLEAWVYYKRFAVSILDVPPGVEEDEEAES